MKKSIDKIISGIREKDYKQTNRDVEFEDFLHEQKIYTLIEAYKLLYRNKNMIFESLDGNHKLDKTRFCLDWQNGHIVTAIDIGGIDRINEWKLIKE